jgi:sodium transport system permease protein
LYNSASDKSQLAHARLLGVLDRWIEQIGDHNLSSTGVPKAVMRPFLVESADVANIEQREASMWSKILPVLLILWTMTGAFYPAVDLCAGEKERGTLETLLSSPAGRGEIVMGKLVTIMLFSVATALLNLISMGLTGWVVVTQLPGFGPPPLMAVLTMVIALVPIAALFSALCLALAAFARSTKEGQYYLMPLMLVTMPLVILPMSPGVELNLGNSLIPITGMVLLLRSVLEGNYWQAVQFSPSVALITLTACLLAIRWAVDQFNTESVLFRESERLDLRLWLRHLRRDRKPTPTVAAAMFCGVLILIVKFFMGVAQPAMDTFGDFTKMVLATQLIVILAPALLMTGFLTSSPRETLLLKMPRWATIPAAIALAAALHPATNWLQTFVSDLYQINDSVKPALLHMQQLLQNANFWPLVLVIAALPAMCEELAFRGFILSGFRHVGHKWRAIFYTAVFFALTHGVIQQSLIACLLGVVLGFLAVQSGSILPGMVFHVLHNTLALANSRLTADMIPNVPWIKKLILPVDGGGCTFAWPVVVVGLLVAVLILVRFGRLSCAASSEEILTAAIERGSHDKLPMTPEEACL